MAPVTFPHFDPPFWLLAQGGRLLGLNPVSHSDEKKTVNLRVPLFSCMVGGPVRKKSFTSKAGRDREGEVPEGGDREGAGALPPTMRPGPSHWTTCPRPARGRCGTNQLLQIDVNDSHPQTRQLPPDGGR